MTTSTRTPAGELSATAARHLLLNMTPNGSLGPEGENLLVIRRGEGPYVDDADGRRYIDGLSGLYCCQLGYSYGPEFAEAAQKQLRELCYSPLWTSSAHPTAIELAERLSRIAPVDIEHTFSPAVAPKPSRPPGRSPAATTRCVANRAAPRPSLGAAPTTD